jgi:Flp pilus assembly protein TadD
MARCWTCGSYTPDLSYSCVTCLQLNALKQVRDAAHAASIDSAERLDAIAELHRKTHQALLDGFNQLNQTLEWGFSGLLWAIDQQTEVLRSIDNTLKTPSKSQADEWRIIGEQMRLRGDSGAATKFFTDALELYPLDYRIYLGLAHAYFELSRFEDADRVLVESLPHAPRSQFDYRSVSYRLMGRIRFCNEEYHDAVEQLRHAVAVEPKYAKAYYDLAQYSSCVGAERDCVIALRDAIALEPNYWYAARAEPLFDSVRPHVDAALQVILAASLSQVEQELLEAASLITAARPKADECGRLAGALRKPTHSATLVAKADKAFDVARAPFDTSDYKTALTVARTAAAARVRASDTLNRVDLELQSLITAEKARQAADEAATKERAAAEEKAKKEREAAKASRRRLLVGFVVGVAVYLLAAGGVGFSVDHSLEGFVGGITYAIAIPAVLGLLAMAG